MTLLLNDEQITSMRETLNRSLPEMAVIYRLTRTDDTSGGTTETLEAGDPIECRVAPLGGGVGAAMAESLIVGRVGTADSWMVTFPADTDVRLTDSLIVLDDRPLEVVAVLAPRSWELSRRVVCVELK